MLRQLFKALRKTMNVFVVECNFLTSKNNGKTIFHRLLRKAANKNPLKMKFSLQNPLTMKNIRF